MVIFEADIEPQVISNRLNTSVLSSYLGRIRCILYTTKNSTKHPSQSGCHLSRPSELRKGRKKGERRRKRFYLFINASEKIPRRTWHVQVCRLHLSVHHKTLRAVLSCREKQTTRYGDPGSCTLKDAPFPCNVPVYNPSEDVPNSNKSDPVLHDGYGHPSPVRTPPAWKERVGESIRYNTTEG